MTDMTEGFIDIKVSELQNAPLRYAVAVAVGYDVQRGHHCGALYGVFWRQDWTLVGQIFLDNRHSFPFEPDCDWSQCGPLIERRVQSLFWFRGHWVASPFDNEVVEGIEENGHTPLIAACRAIVAAHSGDTARVPRELVEG